MINNLENLEKYFSQINVKLEQRFFNVKKLYEIKKESKIRSCSEYLLEKFNSDIENLISSLEFKFLFQTSLSHISKDFTFESDISRSILGSSFDEIGNRMKSLLSLFISKEQFCAVPEK